MQPRKPAAGVQLDLTDDDYRAIEMARRIRAELLADATRAGGATLTSARAIAAGRHAGQQAGNVGRTEPRLFTPPLRPLTRETTRGWEVIDFARDVLGEPLLPWQEWLVIHAMELLPDGTYRFRTIMALVARQNGKTSLSRTLALWRLYIDGARLVLGAAQDVSIAREVLNAAHDMAMEVPDLAAEVLTLRKTNGDEFLKLINGARYKITASTRGAGRGLSVDHLTMDEIREQRDWLAWSALSKTIMARLMGQIWALSNAGDEASVVLNHLRAAAGVRQDSGGVSYMGEARDNSIGIFEWSAVEGCEIDDEEAWAQANPAMGITVSVAAIRSALGTDPPDVFRTEVLCQKVDTLDGVFNKDAWKACADSSGTMSDHREGVVLCLDVAPDNDHVVLYAAVEVAPEVYRVEPISSWSSTEECRRDLRGDIKMVGPRAFCWFSDGPAIAMAADIRNLTTPAKGERRPLLAEDQLVEISGTETDEACAEFAELVESRRLLHSDDPLLNAHISGTIKLARGDKWRFARRGGVGHVTASYAAAGAVHTVRTLPPMTRTKAAIA